MNFFKATVARDLIVVVVGFSVVLFGFLVAPSLQKKNKNKANNWWNLANVDLPSTASASPVDEVQLPPHGLPLTKRQQKIVYKNPGSVGVIVRAAKMAVEQCGRQFGGRKWNCPSSSSYHGGHVFGSIVKKGCKETAFLHALTSAALTHSVARACSDGTIQTCTCGSRFQRKSVVDSSKRQSCGSPPSLQESIPPKEIKRPVKKKMKTKMKRKEEEEKEEKEEKSRPKSSVEEKKKKPKVAPAERNFHLDTSEDDQQSVLNQIQHSEKDVECQWGGCSDNSEFGLEFSREFIDGSEKDKDLRCAVNLHNNEAGRQHVSRLLQMDCKCHGMSGSCSIKTCWMKMSSFSSVASLIMEKYNSACKVDQENDIRGRTRFNVRPSKLELVYFEDSPKFCEPDSTLNFYGVEGRTCNATSGGDDGCDEVCCGRGYTSDSFEVTEKCNCSFHWCCEVRCDRCTYTRQRHVCL